MKNNSLFDSLLNMSIMFQGYVEEGRKITPYEAYALINEKKLYSLYDPNNFLGEETKELIENALNKALQVHYDNTNYGPRETRNGYFILSIILTIAVRNIFEEYENASNTEISQVDEEDTSEYPYNEFDEYVTDDGSEDDYAEVEAMEHYYEYIMEHD